MTPVPISAPISGSIAARQTPAWPTGMRMRPRFPSLRRYTEDGLAFVEVPPPHEIVPESAQVIDFIWSLFNAWPPVSCRLRRALEARLRMEARRKHSILPSRQAFTTTVDYYEAAAPLLMARARFECHWGEASTPRRMVMLRQALHSLLPTRLF